MCDINIIYMIIGGVIGLVISIILYYKWFKAGMPKIVNVSMDIVSDKTSFILATIILIGIGVFIGLLIPAIICEINKCN